MWGIGLIRGLRNSMRNMLRGPITLQYPFERYELPERARWAPVHLYDEDGAPKCTACMNCVRACPDGCIAIDVATDEDKNKTIVSYRWEMAACMLCGLCEESCPFDAIKLGHDYELAITDPAEFFKVLLEDVPAAKTKRAEKAADKPAEKPAEKPSEESSEKPTEESADPPAEGGDA